MSYPATVFSVMIASPGDVGAERAIAREVIAEWNAVHAKTRRREASCYCQSVGRPTLPLRWVPIPRK